MEYINRISVGTSYNKQLICILFKITGISILVQYAVTLCNDSGETAIASKIDMGGKVIMVSMSIPILAGLLETVLKILP